MDRLLSEVWLVVRGGQRRRAGFSSAVRRQSPAAVIRERDEREDAEHGPIAYRRYVGDGLVLKRHADGFSYHDRLPTGSDY